jgi:predicted nuclease of predicted toxin-antitoxin system
VNYISARRFKNRKYTTSRSPHPEMDATDRCIGQFARQNNLVVVRAIAPDFVNRVYHRFFESFVVEIAREV